MCVPTSHLCPGRVLTGATPFTPLENVDNDDDDERRRCHVTSDVYARRTAQ